LNDPLRFVDPLGLSLNDIMNSLIPGWNALFPDPSQGDPTEEGYWANLANNDEMVEAALGAPPGYMESQRQKLRNMEKCIPDEIYVFGGAGKEVGGKGGEAMGIFGGNMINGDTYWGGIGAAQAGPFGGGAEWTGSDGFTPIGFFDSGFGPGGYVSGQGDGVFLATPTPIFVGIGVGWSQ
jgi:hypothetical protein